MDQLPGIVLLTLMAGMAMPLGATIACVEHIRPRWLEREFRHSVIALGGGALLSAVALVLVPDGMAHLTPLAASVCLIAGGFAFMAIDIGLQRANTPASQLAAMLSDFVPESLALGAAFALEGSNALLLAMLMALQNLPEGFNAYRELRGAGNYSKRRIITLFALVALLGPAAGVAGFLWLSAYPALVSAIMLFAAGGILYSVFEDIAPQAILKKHWAPPMGAVSGFALGVVGHMLTNH